MDSFAWHGWICLEGPPKAQGKLSQSSVLAKIPVRKCYTLGQPPLCVATHINYNSYIHVPFKVHTIPIFCYFLTLEGSMICYLKSFVFDPVGNNKQFVHKNTFWSIILLLCFSKTLSKPQFACMFQFLPPVLICILCYDNNSAISDPSPELFSKFLKCFWFWTHPIMNVPNNFGNFMVVCMHI